MNRFFRIRHEESFTAAKKLRMGGRSLPIVALTASATLEEKVKCAKEGFTDYLSKPIDFARLFDTISKYLNVN